MAVVLRQSKRFSAGSPVTRYWLAHCVGFSLEGDAHGTVERILTDGDPFEPSTLEVRTRHRKLRRVPTAAVVEVVPSERRLVVGRKRRTRAVRLQRREASDRIRPALHRIRPALHRIRPALHFAGRGIVAAGALLLIAALRLAELARAAWHAGYPVAVSAGKRGGKESVRLVRSVPWQEYGRSARSATTRLSQASSSRLSRRPTTSSERSSGKSSADGARTTSSS